jgi:5-methylcytosine-specific restriction endonuclease McrA
VLCPHNGIATGQARRRQKPSHPIDTFCGVPYVKYTREVLAAAVAASTSMAGVLRHLGLGQNGGSHTHLRRRIDRLGIDTGHFLGRAHYRGSVSPRRRSPSEILVVRPAGAKRAAPQVLRRALVAQGRAYRCAECGVSDSWNGRPLTLQIDHIDGRYWDCRPDNLRFLCPNCHSQTSTYAGRNRPRLTIAVVRVDENGDTVEDGSWPGPRTEEEKLAVLDRVERGELTVSDAARLLGCHRNYVYQLRRRLAERGTLAAAPRPAGPPDLGGACRSRGSGDRGGSWHRGQGPARCRAEHRDGAQAGRLGGRGSREERLNCAGSPLGDIAGVAEWQTRRP